MNTITTRQSSTTRSSTTRSGTRDNGGASHDPDEALRELAALPAHHPARPAARDQAIVAWLPLANDLAHRFAGRGEPMQDLVQTATLGLIKAVDRFDVQRGSDFASFAVPTIVGEVKRYFRDQTWQVHVPRRLQELRREVAGSSETLAQQLGRAPTAAEIAGDLGVPEQQVTEARKASRAYTPASLDAPTRSGDEPGLALHELRGEEDHDLARAELRASMTPALATLPERERRILRLRFVENQTQEQIAAQVGVSQMHVSRLLTRSLAALREALVEPGLNPGEG